MRLKFLASMTLILWVSMTEIAGAQFLEYTPPGGPQEEPESRREELERRVEEARYRLGVLRIAPWATLHDVAYVRNFFSTGQEPPDDFTATVGAGLSAFLRTGRKVIWNAELLPEYTWWREQSERSQLNGRYLLGFHGFFNRLTLEAEGGREQQQQIVTPEVPVPVSGRRDGGEVRAELEMTGAVFAYAAARLERQESLIDELLDPRTRQLALLDREERVTQAGVRWRPRPSWMLYAGAERSEVEFESDLLDRSNAGTSPVAGFELRGRRLTLRANLAARDLEARGGAGFVPYDGVTGDAAAVFGTRGRTTATLYANRSLAYSLSPDYPYLEDQRLGLSFDAALGRRLRGQLFAETGDNRYTSFSPLTPQRQDDVFSYGGGLTVDLRRGMSLEIRGLRSRFDSNLPGGDRTYTSLGSTINFAGIR